MKKRTSLLLRGLQGGLIAGVVLAAFDLYSVPKMFADQGAVGYIGYFLSSFMVNFCIFGVVTIALVWGYRLLSPSNTEYTQNSKDERHNIKP